MKLLNKCIPLFAILFFSINVYAQKIKTLSGDVSVLKNESAINIEFVYDGLSVGKYSNEKEYLDKKEEYNKKNQAEEIPGQKVG